VIAELINKVDNFELVRDQIAAILVAEIANQQTLAADAGLPPESWKLRVFTERSNPWEQFLDDDEDTSPLVNVWYDRSNFPQGKSNAIERQASETTYNIDCYGCGRSKDLPPGGHTPGDQDAAFEAQRALRLVRNIIMAAEYTYLGMRGLVWQRWPQSATVFQPQQDGHQAQQIVGARIALRVIFNEFSPQVEPVTLEFLSIDVIRKEDGEIVLEADYDYTL